MYPVSVKYCLLDTSRESRTVVLSLWSVYLKTLNSNRPCLTCNDLLRHVITYNTYYLKHASHTMTINTPREGVRTEKWDQLYEALSAQPRRMIIFSLMKESEEQRLPLPDAAQSSIQPMESENFSIRLRHLHLPKLADAGYIRWESDPFCVQRGPHFEEPAFVVEKLTESSHEYPERLRDECVVIGSVKTSASD